MGIAIPAGYVEVRKGVYERKALCGDDVIRSMPLFRNGCGGAIPTSSLQLKELLVAPTSRDEVRDFIEKWHYSQSINGLRVAHCFQLLTPWGDMIGAAIFGAMAMSGQYKRFAERESDVIELRRLCCIDETPKNTESYFIGKMLRWLKKNTDYKVVVSYADADQGHSGVIYRASNFECLGFKKGGKIIMWNGKRYHDKAVRAKDYSGKIKPFAIRLRQALEKGEASYVPAEGKHTYVYKLK
jgi:hypothetical protein